MATNLDQSLDDIIKSTPRGRGRRDGNSRGQNRGSPYTRRDGGVQKRDNNPPRKQQQQAAQMMMLNNPAYLAALQQQQRQQQSGRSGASGKILINNLDYGVTEADLRALFQQIGPLSKVALNFNRKGTSNGSGMVVFKNPAHAQSAYDRYHNVELDHRKMVIEVVAGGAAAGVMPVMLPAMMAQNFAQPQQAGSSGGRRNRRGGNAQNSGAAQPAAAARPNKGGRGERTRGGRRQDGPAPSAEQLDADLDEYMKDANNAS
ncbi:hypothetical protein IWW50_001916 [Coemansia erecta]|nr:hypothetical protein IWW50_001916 [Coemansia erecta]